MKCTKCDGRKFIELEHGLIMLECDECEGTGEVESVIGGIANDPELFIDIGTERIDKPIGGSDTSQSPKPKKRKAKKKPRKRVG